MKNTQVGHMLEGYDAPAILVSAEYEILATNVLYEETFGRVELEKKPKCFAVSHGYNKPCDQCGEDCPLVAAKTSGQREKVLHIHQGPNGPEHVDVEMTPIFDDDGNLECFVELLKPVPLASGKESDRQVVGKSPLFTRMLEKASKVAVTDATVLLLGESGTGKELVSRLVHTASKRCDNPMVTLECSGLSEPLIESELFGHKKGAFTGAYNDRVGLVEAADGGTLFLDEIGDVSLATQVKLLRLLETKTYRRVGDTSVKTSDFRLICATHKDLRKLVNDGVFRLDLYHRINTFPIVVPPLAQRSDDIPLLTEHLLGRIDKKLHITEAAMNIFVSHQFSGNIRELKNLLTRASILTDTNIIDAEHIRESIAMENTAWQKPPEYIKPNSETLQQNEQTYIQNLLSEYKGDKSAVAKKLGISLRTLYRKL